MKTIRSRPERSTRVRSHPVPALQPAKGGLVLAIRRFLADHSGSGAIEFAIVAPILILLYVGSAEISVAMSIDKKVARASSTIADLVSQQTCVTKDVLATMPDVAQSIMTPYNESVPQLTISQIYVNNAGLASIDWSWDQSGNEPYSPGDPVDLSSDLVVKDSYLIRAEMSFMHNVMMPGVNALGVSSIDMQKTYYLRPRQNAKVLLQASCSPT